MLSTVFVPDEWPLCGHSAMIGELFQTRSSVTFAAVYSEASILQSTWMVELIKMPVEEDNWLFTSQYFFRTQMITQDQVNSG